jgi:hypothetical protein
MEHCDRLYELLDVVIAALQTNTTAQDSED